MVATLEADPRIRQAAVTAAPLDPAALLEAVADPAAGGNVVFVGSVRGTTAGLVTTRLEYEAHQPLAVAVLRQLAGEAADRFGLVAVAVAHRLGVVEPGEAGVVVAASGAHRREAFAAAEWLMDQIKRTVPIWKCEHRPDGQREWVHGEVVPGGGA
ncbi:MAG: molybdenum cofactor biosynthesis protein MoaE [Pirellulales bacterium]|nr:molybdenum cofactor biosynthesis protein MoaE [Pirellulales bacterium]MDA0254704.1 molybdenum cofactor biosynthesis protein MoaE [Planctomycetota bacterium]